MKYPRISWTIIFLLVAYSIISQSLAYLNWDASWLLRCTDSILNSGHYFTDFFETNPPLILWLNIPAVLFAKVTGIDVIISFRIYIYLLILVSLFLLYRLSEKIFAKNRFPYFDVTFITIVLAFTCLPTPAFGEREHICLVLTMPYFFLAVLQLQNKIVSTKFRALIGVWAALGFLLKPYFLLPLVLNECYLMYRNRSIKVVFRTETIIIFIAAWLYLAAIFYFEPNYIYKIVPLVGALYLPFGRVSWWYCLTHNAAFAWFIILLFSCWGWREQQQKELIRVVQIAFIGFIGCYFWQSRGPFYHIIPAIAYSFILISVLVTQASSQIAIGQKRFGHDLTTTLQVIIGFFLVIACVFSLLLKTNYSLWWLRYAKHSAQRAAATVVKHYHYHGAVLVLSERIPLNETVVRYGGGLPATRSPSLIMTSSLAIAARDHLFQHSQQFKAAAKIARQMFITDIKKSQPHMILVVKKEPKFLTFLLKRPEFKQYFANFKHVGHYGPFEVYINPQKNAIQS